KAFVVIVGFIPLFLAFMLFVATRSRHGTALLGPEALTGFTAALLAILPIRLVLVPADIADLTLFDYYLGFEMAVLAAVALIAERRDL
ncbi:MAG TPA: hypothetical protein VFR49_10575, partial [Solirubrobacteraceae bacterium]|nr:hypothetical protein [Solirubrobacteraceae bacterium]